MGVHFARDVVSVDIVYVNATHPYLLIHVLLFLLLSRLCAEQSKLNQP